MAEGRMPALGPGEVHLWRLEADRVADPGVPGRFEALLAPDERARRDRYSRPRSRHEFLLARGLVRTVLAGYTGAPAADLRFAATDTGKPTLAPPALHFNLSHSHGAIVCAVSRDDPLGVDVEHAGRSLEYLDLAERYFAPREVEQLRRLTGDALRAAFFATWTLKEAFVKAIGRGLSFPLDSFAFDLDAGRLAGFHPPASLPGRHWHLFQFEPTSGHAGALVVECRERPAVHFHDWTPAMLAPRPPST